MRDDQAGAIPHHAPQPSQNLFFRVSVHRRERVIEYQDLRCPQNSPGNGRSLFLPAGQRDASFTNHSVKALGKSSYFFTEPRDLCRPFNVGLLRFCDSKCYILGERVAEKKRFLRDVANT